MLAVPVAGAGAELLWPASEAAAAAAEGTDDAASRRAARALPAAPAVLVAVATDSMVAVNNRDDSMLHSAGQRRYMYDRPPSSLMAVRPF